MPFINKYKSCRGITLLKYKNTQIELWYSPANFSVGPHSHSNFTGKLMLLFGNVQLCKLQDNGEVKKSSQKFKFFTIAKNVIHWFEIPSCYMFNLPTVFINIEKWDNAPTSASIDFVKH